MFRGLQNKKPIENYRLGGGKFIKQKYAYSKQDYITRFKFKVKEFL